MYTVTYYATIVIVSNELSLTSLVTSAGGLLLKRALLRKMIQSGCDVTRSLRVCH